MVALGENGAKTLLGVIGTVLLEAVVKLKVESSKVVNGTSCFNKMSVPTGVEKRFGYGLYGFVSNDVAPMLGGCKFVLFVSVRLLLVADEVKR